ncbi:MAG TPA: alkylglycerone-phosphate synthase, partial [Rhodobiaceae bacterium]|nr:alkylglycerone-phosphate synthase [Rhodobiaceae bacterium]
GGAVLTLDTTLMTRIIQIDKVSMTARIEAGIYGPHLEEQLQSHGVTLGHYPQSFPLSTLGGWIAARGAGQQSNRYGKAEKWLVSAKLATPKGFWTTEATPASAAGPNLNQLVAGSEGTLGVIVEATVKIHDLPERKDYRGYLFKTFAQGVEAARRINHAEIPVAMV